ncbi:hypothetical protein K439DRAFT_1288907, partial [Ramaria rubella]
ISIGTPQSEVFIYDAVLLDRSALAPVLDLLLNPMKMKVVWDGRMDYSEIYHTYGTKFENTLDLQIVELTSRVTRGEGEAIRLRRLNSYFFSGYQSTEQYDGLQLVLGMNRFLTENHLASGDAKDASVKNIHQNYSHKWVERPLSAMLLNYAAKDIHLIHLIYQHFQNQGFLQSKTNLILQSQRYVAMHADLPLKPFRNDCYRRSPLLPLDILEEPSGILRECEGCRRKLSLPCFKQKGSMRRKWCKVCQVV